MITIMTISVVLIFFVWWYKPKCQNCGKRGITHSHSEHIGGTWIEVYECKYCKKQYV